MDYAQISMHPATEDDVPFLLALRQEAMDATWLRTRHPVRRGSRITNVQPLDLEKVYHGRR
jgi:hypothetical protein